MCEYGLPVWNDSFLIDSTRSEYEKGTWLFKMLHILKRDRVHFIRCIKIDAVAGRVITRLHPFEGLPDRPDQPMGGTGFGTRFLTGLIDCR